MKSVITIGSGNSGAGAVHDYLGGRKDFQCFLHGNEFRLINDPDGIDTLYQNFYENFSINSSAIAFERFHKYANLLVNIKGNINNKRQKIYPINSKKIIENYINNISYINYYGIPQFKYISLKLHEKILFYIKHNLLGIRINNIKNFRMILPVQEKKFLNETKKFINALCPINKNKNILLDQSASYWKPERYFKYFKNLKIIIVNRDPRSIYYSMKSRNSKTYPSTNVVTFVKWYNYIRNNQSIIKKNKNIYIMQYENFLNNYEMESKKLNNFLGISDKIVSKFKLEQSKKNIYKAKDQLAKKEQFYIKKNLNKYINW
jgi:hypothetical protein